MRSERCPLFSSMYKQYCSHCNPPEQPKQEVRIFHTPALIVISNKLIEFLKSKSADVHIRIHWGKSCDLEVRKFFQSEGIEVVTNDIRPLDNEQYGLSGTVKFPEPPIELLLELHKLDLNFRAIFDGVLEVHSAALAVALIKAGLLADRSAKF